MDKLNPLNPLLGKIQRFEQQEQGQRRWESSRVDWTLKRLKLEQVRRELFRQSDDKLYSFDSFRLLVEFPMHLIADPLTDLIPIHRDQRSVHPFWFQTFRSLPFIQIFEHHLENLDVILKSGKPVGMVFPRKGFAQGLVVHTGDWDFFVPPNTSCHLFKGGKSHEMSFVVQPYSAFVDHMQAHFQVKM